MKDTKESIKDKSQQESGVVLPDGRVIDGNRRLTALRMIERETNISQTFNAVILSLDASSKDDEKIIKELELDLQLGREERVNYDPIDRIFDWPMKMFTLLIIFVIIYLKAVKKMTQKGLY